MVQRKYFRLYLRIYLRVDLLPVATLEGNAMIFGSRQAFFSIFGFMAIKLFTLFFCRDVTKHHPTQFCRFLIHPSVFFCALFQYYANQLHFHCIGDSKWLLALQQGLEKYKPRSFIHMIKLQFRQFIEAVTQTKPPNTCTPLTIDTHTHTPKNVAVKMYICIRIFHLTIRCALGALSSFMPCLRLALSKC